MVEHDFPKVETRVRFPSPAHTCQTCAMFAIMATMASNKEKIVAMLAIIREIRNKLNKPAKPRTILEIIAFHQPITRQSLLEKIPNISKRNAHRKIAGLLLEGKIEQHKEGREVSYSLVDIHSNIS